MSVNELIFLSTQLSTPVVVQLLPPVLGQHPARRQTSVSKRVSHVNLLGLAKIS